MDAQLSVSLSQVSPDRRPVGLVLGAGGARGLAHIGVLKVLAQAELPIDLVVGSSMGGLVGAALAAGLSPAAMERAYHRAPLAQLLLRPSLRGAGLLDPTEIEALLGQLFGPRRIEDLELPFALVAVSLRSGQAQVIRSGPLVEAVMATIAIPLIFPPWRLGDDHFIDGGSVEALPTAVAEAMGARTVVAVDADLHAWHPLRDTPLGALAHRAACALVQAPRGAPTRRWVLRRWLEFVATSPSRPPRADVLIHPTFGRMTANDFHRGHYSIAAGEAAARQALPQLQALVLRAES
ncbi:MAG: patatin-like phospholipase family protein [Chloroflexi bacterium]|nr:patatin-like phospholipase family protein [Chloroflexota bacterium]